MKAWTKFHPPEEFPPALVINNSDRDPWDSRGSSTRRRDIPGYRVDLSRREREREREKREWKKNNEGSPPLSLVRRAQQAFVQGFRKFAISFSLDSAGSRETDILGCRFICSGSCSPSARAPFEGPGTRVLERRARGFQRVCTAISFPPTTEKPRGTNRKAVSRTCIRSKSTFRL